MNRRVGFYYRSAPIVTLAKLIEHFYHRALTESEGGNGASTYLLHYKEGENMTAEQLWSKFAEKNGIKHNEYEAWQFGDAPDKLAELVLRGIKTGTASAEELYKIDNEPLPTEGEYSVILNSRDEAVCVIRTTKVYVVPFCDVSAHHAFCEGEGDRSLAYWRKVHEEFFRNEYEACGLEFSQDIPVVCEEFELLMKAEEC